MPKRYPTELRQRAVRLVAEQRDQYQSGYEAIRPIAAKLGITTPRRCAPGCTRPRSTPAGGPD
jgi:hypothetical protein